MNPSDKIVRFENIAKELAKLYEAKNSDYGDSFGNTWKKLGPISALTRMSDKLERLIQLMTKGGQKVKNESILDTLSDLAAYSIMTIIEIENANGITKTAPGQGTYEG